MTSTAKKLVSGDVGKLEKTLNVLCMYQKNKNNFDAVRLGLAFIVVLSHILALTQLPEFKWFEHVFNSNFAVKGFFAISGFLVSKSYLGSKSLREYAEKRFRRIYPAYISAIIFCVGIGAFTTTIGVADFFSSLQTLKYVLFNAVFLNFVQPDLPFALEGNAIKALNGSLWTIKVEVMLYFCIPVIVYLFKKIGAKKAFVLMFIFSVAWGYFFTFVYSGNKGEEIARQFPGQLSYFSLGALLAFNDRLQLHLKWAAFISVITLFLVDGLHIRLVVEPIAYSCVVVYLSTSAFRGLNWGRYGDLSYGVYLYHFPIIQLLIFLRVFEFNAWLGMALVVCSTIFTAWISWHGIEKRLLKRNSHYLVAGIK